MKLSIFTDETGLDLEQALPEIKKMGFENVDLRWKLFQRSFEKLTDEEMFEIKKMLDANGLKVQCLQSSLAKVHLPDAERLAEEMHKFDRIIRASEIFECKLVRSFFFWQPSDWRTDTSIGALAIEPVVLAEVMEVFRPFAEKAKAAGLILAFENCGCSKEECFKMLDELNVPGWGFAWDPKNSWMRDKAERDRDLDAYCKKIAARTIAVHVKSTGSIWFADGFEPIPYEKVFKALELVGFDGPVSLETHNANPDITGVEACAKVLEVVKKALPSAAAGAQSESCSVTAENIVRSYADDPVRFGVVGLGMGHNRATEMTKTSGVKLVQVCDLNEERCKRTSEALNVPYTTSYSEMLANKDIEAVMVMNETGRHAELVKAALNAGKHVLVTKPMEMTVAKCEEMIALAKAKGLLFAIDHCRRLRPSIQSLKSAYDHGFFGKTLSASVTLKIKRTMEYFHANGGWRGTRELDGGVLSNQSVHHIDELLFAFGMPEAVRADLWTQNHDIEMEDLALAVWRYSNGMIVNITSTTCYPQGGWYYQMEVHGTDGAYVHREAGPCQSPVTQYFKDAAWSEQAPFPAECPWLNAMDNFASALRCGSPFLTTAEEGRDTVRVISAMYESAYERNGAWVEL